MNKFPAFMRPALPSDAPQAVALIRLTMGGEVDWLFGGVKGQTTDEVLASLFRLKANRLSHDLCWLAEVEGRVAGLLLVFPGARLKYLERRTGWHFLRLFGLSPFLRLARIQSAYGGMLEAEKGEFYLSNVAVTPDLQGRGLGSELLTFADRQAQAAGCSKCSLLVSFDNPARQLYERCGFRTVRSFRINHPIIAHGSGGYHRMVKELNPIEAG